MMSKGKIRHLLCQLLGHDWSVALSTFGKLEPVDRVCGRRGVDSLVPSDKPVGMEPPKPWPRPAPAIKPDISGSTPPKPFNCTSSKLPERPDRAPVAEWLDPEVYPPPRGTKILLLTSWEVVVLGHWNDADCIAWAPLMRKPVWLLQRLRELRLSKAAEFGGKEAASVERRDVPKRRATD